VIATETATLSIALRPEKIHLASGREPTSTAPGISATGTIESANFLGGAVLYRVALKSGQHVLAQQPNTGAGQLHAPDAKVTLTWSSNDLVVLKD
jgi:putative spermidine/putrescine transport system ATP-binding protein